VSRNALLLGALFFVASFVISLGLGSANLGHVPWYLSRASGIASFVLLSGSVILGLLISTKAASPLAPRALIFDLHQFLSVLSLSFIGLHAGSLVFDGFLHFSPLELLVPFTAPYRPFWTGLGVIGAWLTVIVTASFWLRKQIGQKRWRTLHYATFGADVLALVHGFTAGTDTQLPFVYWSYVLSAASVAALLSYRITAPRGAVIR
jgi:sulfoxide reductase heme-binding subunit YedZ